MKAIKTKAKLVFITVTFLFFSTEVSLGQNAKEEVQLKGILTSINKRVYGLLKLSKQAQPLNRVNELTEKIRIISIGCPLISDPQNPVSLPDELLQSQEFDILDYQERYYQIKTADGQTGWVSENCTEKFLVEDNSPLDLSKNLLNQNRNTINSLAQDTYNSIIEEFEIAEHVKLKIQKLNITSSEKKKLDELFAEIVRKKSYADILFEKYFEFVPEDDIDKVNILKNLSVNGQLAMGSSNFTKSFAKSSDNVNKAGNSDFRLQMKYRLDGKTNVSFDAGRRRESLQSVYRNSFAGLGYQKKLENLDVGLRARFNNYNDEFREINSYNRINLDANVLQKVNEKVNMNYRYNLLNNTFKNKKESNYARHAIELKALIRTSGLSVLEIGGNSDFSNSDLSFFKYKRFKPALNYSVRKADGGMNKFQAYTEIFNFEMVPLRNNNKYYLGYYGTKQSQDKTHTNKSEASFLVRQFPNSFKNSFYQLKLGKGRMVFGKGNKQINTAIITRFFPDNKDFSHLDLHMDYQSNSIAYYSFTGNVRYWFPGDQNFNTTDIYGKVGLKIKTFSIAPTLGLHANTDLKAEEFSLKSDKNNIRGGIEGRGDVLIANVIRWNFRAAYEYGFVYNAQVESFGDLGEIVYGNILQRNPHSLQIQSDVSAKVFRKAEIFGSFRYFTYETDFVSQLSVSPVVGNNRLSAQLGLRFRYN